MRAPSDTQRLMDVERREVLSTRYQIMEVYAVEKFTEEYIRDIAASLKKHKGWAVAIGNFDKSKFLIFDDRILVRKEKFGDCTTLPELVRKAQAKSDFKP